MCSEQESRLFCDFDRTGGCAVVMFAPTIITAAIIAATAHAQQICYDTPQDCPAAPPPAPCDVCKTNRGNKADVTSLTFRYEPRGVTLKIVDNSKGKYSITGVRQTTENIKSITCEKATTSISGKRVTLSNFKGSDAGPCTSEDFDGNRQTYMIHVSCSAPLHIDDRWGSLILVDFTGDGYCPTPQPPPCVLCCTQPPIVDASIQDIWVNKVACENGQLPFGSYEREQLFRWWELQAGANCRTQNIGPNAGVSIAAQDASNPQAAITFEDLTDIICTATDYCPDVSLVWTCTETCTPISGSFDAVEIGPSTFHVGVKDYQNCPQQGPPVPGDCNICCPSDSNKHGQSGSSDSSSGSCKVKPNSLTFKYVGGTADFDILSGLPTKHLISGSTLSTQLLSVSCDNSNVVVSGNDIVISGFSGSSSACTVTAVGGAQQHIDVHVSCSTPLNLGDRLGSLEISGFTNDNGNWEDQCPLTPAPMPPTCELCCVNMPTVVTTNTTEEKISTCFADQLPSRTLTNVQQWLDSFECNLQNTVIASPVISYYHGINLSVPFDGQAASIQDDLCVPSTGTPCYEMTVRYSCCDPCRATAGPDGDALCVDSVATFSLTDTSKPTIAIEDKMEECDATLQNPGLQVMAGSASWINNTVCRDDGQTIPLVVTPANQVTTDPCAYSLAANFYCNDECGNDKSKNQSFNVVDTTAPRITQQPQDAFALCGDDFNQTILYEWIQNHGFSAANDCSMDLVVTNMTSGFTGTCPQSMDVAWQYCDPCGHCTTTATATFFITDPNPPVVSFNGTTCVDNGPGTPCYIQVQSCESNSIDTGAVEEWLHNHGGLDCSDSCGNVTWDNYVIFDQSLDGCNQSVTAKFTCRDGCNMVTSAYATLDIVDTEGPFIVANISTQEVECDGKGNADDKDGWVAKWTGQISWADDACKSNPSCGNHYLGYDRMSAAAKMGGSGSWCTNTWDPVCANGVEYTNNCHAAMNAVQSYSPGQCASGPPPVEVGSYEESLGVNCTLHCISINHDPVCGENGVTYDNYCLAMCNGVWTMDKGTCSSLGVNSGVTYGHQNCNWCNGGVTLEVCGADDITYQSPCLAECYGQNSYTVGMCASDCQLESQIDYVLVDVGEPFTDDNGCVTVIPHTFEASDGCGTPVRQVADFEIRDTTLPVLSPCVDTTVECDGDNNRDEFNAWIDAHGYATCQDTCSDCTWTNVTYARDNDGNPLFVPCDGYSTCEKCVYVAFSAVDQCGNEQSTGGVFKIIDTTPPLFDVESDAIECTGDYPIDYILNDANAYLSDDFPDCSTDIHFVTRVVVFKDAYKNGTGTMPSGVVGYPPNYVPPTVLEDTEEKFPFVDFSEHPYTCPFILVLEVTASDGCGNSAVKNATRVFKDEQAPTFITAPQDTTAECSDWNNPIASNDVFQTWLANGGGGRCSDSCTALPFVNEIPSYDFIAPETGKCPSSVTVTFTCMDYCHNVASMDATFHLQDTVDPVVTAVDNEVVECGPADDYNMEFAQWIANNGGAAAVDTCTCTDLINVTHNNPVLLPVGPRLCNNSVAQGVFTFTDECGNAVARNGTFSVLDSRPPVVTGGFSLYAYCDDSCANKETKARATLDKWLAGHGCLAAADCQEVMTWHHHPEQISGTLCGTSAEVLFTVTDACGNAATPVTLTYTFENIRPPPPPSPPACEVCSKNNKRALRSIVFRYDGSVPGVVSSSNSRIFKNVVPSGDTFAIFSTQLKDQKFATNTVLTVNGVTKTFHTSCSQPINTGDKLFFGNGESLTIVGFKTHDGGSEDSLCAAPLPPYVPDCTADVDDVDVCSCVPPAPFPVVPVDVCEDDAARPTSIALRYIGGRALTNVQEGKAAVSGASVATDTATVRCDSKRVTGVTRQVGIGGTYVFGDASSDEKLGSNVECTIMGSNGASQAVEIHTSCSMPLRSGDIFGALQLVCFSNTVGENTCASTLGPSLSPNGCAPLIPTPVAPVTCTICDSYNDKHSSSGGGSKPKLEELVLKYIGGRQLTNDQNGKAYVSNGVVTSDSVSISCNVAVSPLTGSTLKKSSGSSGSSGSISSISSSGSSGVSGQAVVVLKGGLIRLSEFDSSGTECNVMGIGEIQTSFQQFEIHTSCSQLLQVNDIFGAFQVIAFESTVASVQAGECPGEVMPDTRQVSQDLLQYDSMKVPASPDADSCAVGEDVCANEALVTSLTFEYTGGNTYDHTQPMDAGNYLFNEQYTANADVENIRVTSGNYGLDLSETRRSERFVLSAAALEKEFMTKFVNLIVGNSRVRLVASCVPGFPLRVGDNFGPVRLVGYGNNGGTTGNAHACHLPTSDAFAATPAAGSGTTASTGSISPPAVAGMVVGGVLVVVLLMGVVRHSNSHNTAAISEPPSSTVDETNDTVMSGAFLGDMAWDAPRGSRHLTGVATTAEGAEPAQVVRTTT